MYSLIFSQRNHELDKDFRYVCKQQNTVAVMTSHMTARGLFWEIMMTSIRSLADQVTRPLAHIIHIITRAS